MKRWFNGTTALQAAALATAILVVPVPAKATTDSNQRPALAQAVTLGRGVTIGDLLGTAAAAKDDRQGAIGGYVLTDPRIGIVKELDAGV